MAAGLDTLRREIDAAAFDDRRFDAVVAALADAIGAQTATLWLIDEPATDTPPMVAMYRMRPTAPAEFAHYWHMLDPWSKRARELGGMVTGLTAIGSELIDRREVGRSPFYNEWAKEHGMHAMLSSVVVGAAAPGAPPRSLASFYRPADADEFSPADRATLLSLLPRLQASLALRDLWRSALRLAGDARRAFDALDAAAWLLDARLRVRQANDAARSLMRRPGLVEHRDGRLVSLGARQLPRLAEAAARAFASGLAQPLVVEWPGPPPALARARVLPLHPAHKGQHGRLLLVAELPSADDWLALVARMYALTPAEARVAAALATGDDPATIADRQGLQLTTVRTHLRHAMAKTGSRRSADLVRLLAGLRL